MGLLIFTNDYFFFSATSWYKFLRKKKDKGIVIKEAARAKICCIKNPAVVNDID